MNMKIHEYIREHIKADDYTLGIYNNESHETRFAQNGITQHITGPKIEINLKVSFGKRSGSSFTNQSDETSLKKLIADAEAIAQMAPEDPEHIPSAPAADLPEVENSSPATLSLKPEEMVEIVQRSIDKAIALDATVSGMCEKHYHEECDFSKNGFVGSDISSSFGHSMTLKKGDVETKVSFDAKDYAAFDLEREFAQLSSQATALADLRSFEPEKIAVILRPHALEELFWFMMWGMNRRQADEGFTAFSGQLGKEFLGKDFSLYSTLKRPELLTRRYDRENVPASETCWVERGVLQNMLVNRQWAQKIGETPKSFYNFYVPGGAATEAEMMKMVPRGLIINRFWYIRPVDMKVGELTGMTRDGVLYFENGEVKHAVNNLRFNEIPHEVTRRILALGPSILASSISLLPTLLVEDFNFVDKTSF